MVVGNTEPPPDLVLTDLSMPNMDGLELVRRLRESGYRGAAAVITGYGEDAFDTAREVGVDKVLRKPISRAELGEAIAGLLPESRS
jgi:two-component system response regulator YesN